MTMSTMTRVPFLYLFLSFFSHETDAFLSGSIQTRSSMVLHANPPVTYRKKAIIVGGGPVGLATAITLSSPPHCMNVTLFEQSTPSAYDATKAYLYMVNGRGQTWTERFPAVQQLLEERGSGAMGGFGGFCIVPADPKVAIPEPKQLSISDMKMVKKSYWIPRHTMTSLLEEVIQEQQVSGKDGYGSVDICLGKKFVNVETADGGMLKVTVQNVEDPNIRYQESFTANLIVAADGMNSAVRDCLGDDVTKPLKTNWLTMNPHKFRVRRWTSPASGLRMKVLQFPPGFSIPDTHGTSLKTESETVYAIRSVNKGPRDYVSLGLLPVKDPKMVRPTNVITRPNHDIWKLKGGSEIKQWFMRSFPRLNFDELIDDTEWDRFAKAQGTSFPKCQYCPGLQVSSPDGSAGVVLVGDAIHAFPPDIGQGINSGLSDVEALDRALQGKDILTNEASDTPPASLGDALKEYERVRAPEIKALIRLARFGSPYQYRQPLYRDRVGRSLWTMNVAMRMILNKLSRGLIPPAAIIMAQDKNMTFRKLMRRADVTTAGLMATLFASLFCVLRPFIKLT